MRIYKLITLLLVILLISIISFGCKTYIVNEDKNSQISEENKNNANENNEQSTSDKNKEISIDYKNIKPNENGQVMILMYHSIGSSEKEWVRTAENFKKDLDVLYQKGYRLISLKDYVENNIKVEAGYTPVIMTFDDGLQNNFNIIEENETKKIDAKCAVGIIEDFYKLHPDFGRAASFYVFYPIPFRQKELIKEKYEFLIKNGYEIGNHGYTHEDLLKLNGEEVQKALAKNVISTREYLNDYEVFSIALPYGHYPKDEYKSYAVSGEYEGTKYEHKAILKVGSNPAPSPADLKFDPLKLPRVRASEINTAGTGMYDWLEYFEKHPEKRYISDGDSYTIVIPEEESEKINRDILKGKQVIIYKKE